ncbi:type II secretion system protein GspE [Entomohabitans teleogrylli]|uniref:type II secretion system protein GspE n=1 Tax=Entomohabitans teleogrylli TaxID=1384589 RepID=UPI00073DA080|nr:type II secretion system protein GspE [Entomohabitans teleogrylli]
MDIPALNQLCRHYHALLIHSDEESISIAVVGAPQEALLDALRFTVNKRIHIECWSEERLEKAFNQHSAQTAGDDAPVTGQVDNILTQAVQRRASDIHIEPGAENLSVRLRIDGVLQPLLSLPAELAAGIATRLKVAAELDIAERRLPQDGQFSRELAEKSVTFRISTLPCCYGEKIVLRLQEQEARPLSLAALGMPPHALEAYRRALACPQGLILVTGPTGSGKTITLYSGLNALNTPQVNISSVEDPVEIALPGINQTRVNPRAGLDYQTILRALLRQDPDVIMIGEIRDRETAEIAVKAAQTGHLVLATLHTNSTTETLIRLQQMGISGWMIASALRLIVAQRLARRLCPRCRRQCPAQEDNTSSSEGAHLNHWQAGGCEHCYSGFYGRIALFETLIIDGPLKRAIASDAGVAAIELLAQEQGMETLHQCGTHAVGEGLTTQEELLRVLGYGGGY